jgi:hypothetical protein
VLNLRTDREGGEREGRGREKEREMPLGITDERKRKQAITAAVEMPFWWK